MFKEIEFAGLKFKNPFVVASGRRGATVERLVKAEDAGAAGVSVKLTFTKQPFYGRLRMYSNPGILPSFAMTGGWIWKKALSWFARVRNGPI